MSVVKYHNDHQSVKKDQTIANLIPDAITECALWLQKGPNEPCSSDSTVAVVGAIMGVSGAPNAIISAAKEKLNCGDERCVLNSLRDKIGSDVVAAEINTRFKLIGPNGIELLSNYDIDDTLAQWTNRWEKFYPYNFNMINYASYSIVDGMVVNRPDTLATLSFSDLYYGKVRKQHKYIIVDPSRGVGTTGKVIYGDNAPGYSCGGCVINSDKYQGRGKHWMALFWDARGDNWSVEFFNSGGNGPAPEWINWVIKTSEQMKDVAKSLRVTTGRNITITPVRTSSIRHQHSKTECGLYSLFYIYARLSGVPYEYFHKNPVPDQLMFELRQHLFEGKGGHKGVEVVNGIPRFNFDKFNSEIKIEWERD